jgi:hypothetical protein
MGSRWKCPKINPLMMKLHNLESVFRFKEPEMVIQKINPISAKEGFKNCKTSGGISFKRLHSCESVLIG